MCFPRHRVSCYGDVLCCVGFLHAVCGNRLAVFGFSTVGLLILLGMMATLRAAGSFACVSTTRFYSDKLLI
jgi:hypothetical protein